MAENWSWCTNPRTAAVLMESELSILEAPDDYPGMYEAKAKDARHLLQEVCRLAVENKWMREFIEQRGGERGKMLLSTLDVHLKTLLVDAEKPGNVGDAITYLDPDHEG
jgi:hypothetical protein